MTTLSIPVDEEMSTRIQSLIKQGYIGSVSEFGRMSMKKRLDEIAVEMVLAARDEPSLSGDLDELAEKI